MANLSDVDADGNIPRRRYDGAARRGRAADSRRRIIEAAADLFAERGYAATTLDLIAARAGVTTKLVVANGPKSGLLLAAFEQRFGGAEGAGPHEAGQSAAAILSDPDPDAVLTKLADFVLAGHERGIGLWRAFRAAAEHEPEVRAAYQEVARGRHEVMRLGVDLLAQHGLLRAGDREQQTATLALLMGFDPYQLMVADWGWSREQLRSWLIEALRATLVQRSENSS